MIKLESELPVGTTLVKEKFNAFYELVKKFLLVMELEGILPPSQEKSGPHIHTLFIVLLKGQYFKSIN